MAIVVVFVELSTWDMRYDPNLDALLLTTGTSGLGVHFLSTPL